MKHGFLKHGFLKHGLRGLAGLGLLLLSSAALALGLGEIRVLSQPGQPLIAEIPIISNEPGELEQLQARLASPVTFERVGLARPQGLVSSLDFAIALGDDGRPLIRVTSREPVQVASVNFLIEVEWGQGRLVREYSALVSTPGALAAEGEPVIEAPLPPPSSTIIREPEPLATVPVQPEPAPTPAVEPTPEPTRAEPVPPAVVASTPAPSVADLLAASGDVEVRSGQTLSQIARDLGQGSLDQTMIALLRANPEAFIRGNINLLKTGAVLRVPPASELGQLQASEATALVREQNAQWRQARQPIPQPADAGPSAPTPAPASAAAPAAAQVAQARLEIAPPAADSSARAGTQSGTDAEGEGDMLANQSLTAAREDLAARESEVQELRAQVVELENLKQQQAELIAMKDTELAAAQQALAQNQGDAGQPLWLWAGIGLLVLGLVVAWLLSRRRAAPTTLAPRAGYDTAAMAAAVPVGAHVTRDEDVEPENTSHSDVYYDSDIPATLPESEPAPDPEPARVARPNAATGMPPAWTSAALKPTWHTGDMGAGIASLNPAPAGRERLELAIAYMDLGDVETARDLLNEVVAGGDSGARDEASQLLRELG